MPEIIPGLADFLDSFPQMAVRPAAPGDIVIKGKYAFTGRSPQFGEITDSFQLCIKVPRAFPHDLPTISETAGRIPANGDFHVNQDGTMCLGSPLRLLHKLSKSPTLNGFSENCLVPYLYAISYKLRNGGKLVFDELPHGNKGMLLDYMDLFGLTDANQVKQTLKMLGMKKRRANKLACPCGCGHRLGRCDFNAKLRQFRVVSNRRWFRAQVV